MILRYCSNSSSSCCSLLWKKLWKKHITVLYMLTHLFFFSMLKNSTPFSHFLCRRYLYDLSPSSLLYKILQKVTQERCPKQSDQKSQLTLIHHLPGFTLHNSTGVAEETHVAVRFGWAYCVEKSSWVWIWMPRPLGHLKLSASLRRFIQEVLSTMPAKAYGSL